LNGRNPYLIQDQFIEISKVYFRKAVVNAGGQIAGRIADWDGKNFKWLPRPDEKEYTAKGEVWSKLGKKRPILIKLYDAFFQAGDKCIKEFDQNNPKDVEDLLKTLKEEYDGVPTLIMDLVDPDQSIGRHGFDIRTILCPDGSIQLYHSNFLGGCEDYFVWSANWNCTVDFVNEKCFRS
jgi:hypothetical protein